MDGDGQELKERRKALGWSRAELAMRAQVDRRVLQLLELGLSQDDESLARVLTTLDGAESEGMDNGAGDA